MPPIPIAWTITANAALSRCLFVLIIGCATLCLLLVSGCTADEDDADRDQEVPRIALPVEVFIAEGGDIAQEIEVQARLQSTRRRDLVLLAAGIVAEAPVRDGDVVSEGQVLLRLDPLPGDMDTLAEAESRLQRARRALERLQSLQQRVSGAVAQSEIDQAQDAVEDAQRDVERAQRDHGNRQLVAPFAGVVHGIDDIVEGQRLEAGSVLARLQEVGSFTTPIKVPETVLGQLSLGLEVKISPLGQEPAVGQITSLPGAISRDSGTGTVMVLIDDAPESWRPGAFALMRIRNEKISGEVVLPRAAIQYRRNRAHVWEVFNDEYDEKTHVVRRSWLTLGQGDEDQVIVEEGLKAGAVVVRDGTSGLADDVPVLLQGLEDIPPLRSTADLREEQEAAAAEQGGRGRRQ